MQDAINMPSSFITLLFEFHMKASHLVTLSYFMNKMKLSNRCFKANLDGHVIMRFESPVDLTWLIMIGIANFANFSNSPKLKLVKNLNKLSVAHMVTRMFHALTSRLIDCPFFSSNSTNVKYSQVLTQVIATCIAIWSSIAISLAIVYHHWKSLSQDVVKWTP